ncbi:MAG: phosphatase PAP2 family protein [bacterium]|nr:phosphatase PAP2 family protein [bacterium]
MKIKKFFIYVLMVLFLLHAVVLEAAVSEGKEQQEDEKKQEKKKKSGKDTPFFKSLVKDQGRIWSSPARMKGKDFIIWGGVAALTGLLIANDESIYREFKDYQAKHKWVDDISPHITKLGLGEWNLGIAGAFYLGGLILKDKKAKETARLTLMTFIHTGLVVQVGKHLSGRQEPGWQEPGEPKGVDHWYGPSGFFKRYKSYQLRRYDAFPSGHTITIFGTATVIAEMYKDTVWVPILSYATATLCGLSRVTEETHWLSDVFLGAVLGYAIGKFVVKRRNRQDKLRIYPVANTRQVGISLNYVF